MNIGLACDCPSPPSPFDEQPSWLALTGLLRSSSPRSRNPTALAVPGADVRGPAPGAVEDADLLRAVGEGDRGEPMRELYRRYAARIYGLGMQLLSDRGLAEELVQETFVRLWRTADRFDPERGSPPSFIFAIARRLAIDLWRRPSSRPLAVDDPPPADDHMDRVLLRLDVREALDSLSDAHRQVLELSYQGQLKQTEIAERLGIPLGTVKTRSFHAMRSLKAALDQRGIHG
jgi:RNA polymerase sigma-70 factor (ECF subfamily)